MTENNTEDLEYNDGLAKMLRSQDNREFSWSKTLSIAGIMSIAVILFFIIGIKTGKNILVQQAQKAISVSDNNNIKENLASNAEITAAINQTIDAIDDALEGASLQTTQQEVAVSTETIQKETAIQPPPKTSIQSVRQSSITPTVVPKGARYKVIAGSFNSYKNARHYAKLLAKEKIPAFIWKYISSDGTPHFRVQVAAFFTAKDASGYSKRLKSKGFDTFVIVKP